MASKLLSGKNIMAIVISIVMITSVIGFVSFSSYNDEYTYNGYKFVLLQDGYHVKVGKRELVFTHLPSDLNDVNLSSDAEEALRNTRLIMATSDFNSSHAESIAGSVYYLKNALSAYSVYVMNGFTTATPRPSPLISCRNATLFIPVIYFEDSENSDVSRDGNCIRVQVSSPEYASKFSQMVVYKISGIA